MIIPTVNRTIQEFYQDLTQQDQSKESDISPFNSVMRSSTQNDPNPGLIPNPDPNLIPNPNEFIFNQASSQLWYNWATNVGKEYVAISYSAGTTWLFNNSQPPQSPQSPQINIFKKEQINVQVQSQPIYKITLEKEQGIRSLLLIDDNKNPYLLIGTFVYPQDGIPSSSKLLKWYFKSNILTTIYICSGSNSIRSIRKYYCKKEEIEYILFSGQDDTITNLDAKIFYIKEKNVNNCPSIQSCINIVSFRYNKELIIGSVWDFKIDSDTIYISIPIKVQDIKKKSGFKILARLFYCTTKDFFNKKNKIRNYSICVENIIGNSVYPNGFNIDSISTVQIETNKCTGKVYIYTLSDFLVQIDSLSNTGLNLSLQSLIKNSGSFTPDTPIFDLIKLIQDFLANLDIDGTRILYFNKDDLYKKNPPILKICVGNPISNTIYKSTTSNGYNNYLNVYTWSSTSCRDLFYFGTLDIRAELYVGFVNIIAQILQNPLIVELLLSLPEEQIIFITELFNKNFSLPIDFTDKKLYFDVIQILDNSISKVTSSGFNNTRFLSSTAASGVRNLNIIKNDKGKFLTIGTTVYQPTNSAKVYTLKI